MSTIDLSHLHALELNLSHERSRLANAKTNSEKALRQVWVAQLEKEVGGEKKFLGIDGGSTEIVNEDDLLRELGC